MKYILALLLALCLVYGAFCENELTTPVSSTTTASTTTKKSVNVNTNNACDLPKAVGRCRAKKTRYFFNSESDKCEKFQYGGCDGNANQFFTKEACKKACM